MVLSTCPRVLQDDVWQVHVWHPAGTAGSAPVVQQGDVGGDAAVHAPPTVLQDDVQQVRRALDLLLVLLGVCQRLAHQLIGLQSRVQDLGLWFALSRP